MIFPMVLKCMSLSFCLESKVSTACPSWAAGLMKNLCVAFITCFVILVCLALKSVQQEPAMTAL